MNKRFQALDSFRGLFCLCIVVYHTNIAHTITTWKFFRHGPIWVDFFFILSGFVLTHAYANRKLHFKSYSLNRFFRIFPLHIFMLLVTLIMETGKLLSAKNGVSLPSEPFTGNTAVSEILPNLFLVQSWTTYTQKLSFNYPSWSISVEFLMYIVFFLSLLVPKKMRPISWGLIMLLSLYSLLATPLFTDPIRRGLFCFFAGSMTFALYERVQDKLREFPKEVFHGFEALLLSGILFIPQVSFAFKDQVATLLSSATIFIFALEKGWFSSFFSKKPFLKISEVSYSIYMIHTMVLTAIMWVLAYIENFIPISTTAVIKGHPMINFDYPIVNHVLVFVCMWLVYLCSKVTNKFIEKPGQRLGKRLAAKS